MWVIGPYFTLYEWQLMRHYFEWMWVILGRWGLTLGGKGCVGMYGAWFLVGGVNGRGWVGHYSGWVGNYFGWVGVDGDEWGWGWVGKLFDNALIIHTLQWMDDLDAKEEILDNLVSNLKCGQCLAMNFDTQN